MKEIHPHTFGRDRGLEVLVDIINKSPKHLRKRANSFIQKYIRELGQFQYIKDYQVRMWLLQRTKQFYSNELTQDKLFDNKLKDFINNALVTLYRNKYREFEQKGFRGSDGRWHNFKRNCYGKVFN